MFKRKQAKNVVSAIFFMACFLFHLPFCVGGTSGGKDSTEQMIFKHSSFTKRPQKQVLQLPFLEDTRLENLGFSGTVDFVSFYRNMSIAYPDMSSPMKDLEFTPYPGGNQYNANFYRQPLLNLFISGSPSRGTSFAIEYAMSHFYTGLASDSSKKLNVQNVLQFHGNVNTSYGSFMLTAGGGAMNYSMSPFTMYNKDFREPMFEKLPWDWYTDASKKYNDLFNYSSTSNTSYLTNTATQGFILEGTNIPGNIGFSAFYGRSSFTTIPDRVDKGYPVEIFAGRLNKGNDSTGKIGINYYNLFGYTDRVKRIHDSREILTADFLVKNSKYKVYAEAGVGSVHNPASSGELGAAFSVGFNLYNTKRGLPIYVQAYSVDVNVAALESAVLNANASVMQGGYGTDPKYNNGYYPAFLQEVGMMSNNRNGVILKIDKVFDKFRIELGNAVSQEKQNIFQGVSFGQMVNAFSRSRFTPWTQGAGPYGRINNRFRRSFETLAITDTGAYLKAFNAADLTLKVKLRLFKREVILSNYCFAGSVGKTISIIPVFNESSFIRTFFEEFSAYFPLRRNIMLIGFYSIQTNKGNNQTQLSTENGKPIDQIGTGYGFGIDYDFASNAGLFLRQRWMEQTDSNFSADRFKGTETMLELKVFF
jgi:hypothetical protein